MTDFRPDEDEEWINDDEGEGEDDPTSEATENNPVSIGRVSLGLGGRIYADVYVTIPKIIIDRLDIDIAPLMTALGKRKRTPEEKFLDETGIETDPDFTPPENARGPYYGRATLESKLRGMRAAWHYIERIVCVPADDEDEDGYDVYFIVLERGAANQHGKHARGRRKAA